VNGFVHGNILIEFIRIHHRAVFNAGCASRTPVFDDVAGLFYQFDLEIPLFPLYAVNFRITEDLYVGMPADLDQFGRQNSHGTVIGGESLVELGHVASNARRLVNQINFKPGFGQIQSGLNAADAAADHHDVCEISVVEIFTKLSDLFVFHCPIP
jgi:hypothetical protein